MTKRRKAPSTGLMESSDIISAIGFDTGEPAPFYYPPMKDRSWHTLEYSSPLGLAGFGFGWDAAFWFYKSFRRNGIDHHDSDFWDKRDPDWKLVRQEVRRATDYNPAYTLPLVP